MKIVDNFKVVPWKNGGGVTTELYRLDSSISNDSFLFRLSLAEVKQDGPFSLFPGIDRILVLLDGQGFILKNPKSEICLNQKLSPINFSGEEKIDCYLINEPCRDFNIMVKRDWGKATVAVETISANENKIIKNLCGQKFIYAVEKNLLYVLWQNEAVTIEATKDTTLLIVDLVT